jgi:hypothetical protein
MPVIQRLQNAVLEENGSTSSDDATPSVQVQKDGLRHAPIGPLPLQERVGRGFQPPGCKRI